LLIFVLVAALECDVVEISPLGGIVPDGCFSALIPVVRYWFGAGLCSVLAPSSARAALLCTMVFLHSVVVGLAI
jgi:hypothetical protein